MCRCEEGEAIKENRGEKKRSAKKIQERKLLKRHLSAGYTGSKLKRVLETDVQESGLKIKVVEKVGTNIKRMVQSFQCYQELNFEMPKINEQVGV